MYVCLCVACEWVGGCGYVDVYSCVYIGMCECGWCDYGCVCVVCEWVCGGEYVDVYRCMCKCVHVHWGNPFSSMEVMQRAGIYQALSGQGFALAFV